MLKSELTSACLTCVHEGLPFTVKCGASNHTLAYLLIVFQFSKSVALSVLSERQYLVVEKEAAAIIDAIQK